MTPESLINNGLVPAWVRYLAQDECGDWYGFAALPSVQEIPTGPPDFGYVEVWETGEGQSYVFIAAANKPNPRWRNTLFNCLEYNAHAA